MTSPSDRLQLLSETMRAFAQATESPHELLRIVAQRVAEAFDAYCGLSEVSGDGRFLEPKARYSRDPEVLAAATAVTDALPSVPLDGPHPLPQALRFGTCVQVPEVNIDAWLADVNDPELVERVRRLGLRGALFVPMHARGELIGGLSVMRYGAGAPDFEPGDRVLAQNLADHAALSIKNARLIEHARRQLAEKQRMADRLHLLAALTREFLAAARDPSRLLATVARRVSEVVGDVCSIRMLSDDRTWMLPVGASYDPSPGPEDVQRRALESQPQRIGDGVSGRVAASGTTLLLPALGPDFLAAVTGPVRAAIASLGMTSLLSVPLREHDQVIGVITVYRRDAERPYDDEDRTLLEDIAIKASLVWSNARLLEAEQVLRRGFLESAPDPVVIVDAAGAIALVNARTEAVFGYTRAELIGMPFARLVSPAGVARRKDGSEFQAETSQNTIASPDGPLIAAIVRDVTERRRELEERHRKIEEANRLKSEFLANMSHELRTPLNGIIGFASLMHSGKAGPMADDHREYLGDILLSSRHLLQLINDILDLSKIEAGRLEVRSERLELGRLAGEVCDSLRTLAAEKALNLGAEITVNDVTLDPMIVRQILYNYLSNAIKFTPDGGRVMLRITPAGDDALRIDVEDTGIGIRPEDHDRLFVEFTQLDAGAGKRHQGTGLGLALTRRLAMALGGRVEVNSVFGVGSTFSAILPRVVTA